MVGEYGAARWTGRSSRWVGVVTVREISAEYDVWSCSHAHADTTEAWACARAEQDRRYARHTAQETPTDAR